MTISPFTTAAVGGAGFGFQSEPAGVRAEEPAWMSAFRATLDEIHEKGFRGYAEDLNTRKLEELRKKILESMGLSEQSLAEMSSEQRAAVERTVAEEIRKRLAAQAEMEGKGDMASAAPGSPEAAAGAAPQQAAARQGFGPGFTLMQAIASRSEPEPEPRQ